MLARLGKATRSALCDSLVLPQRSAELVEAERSYEAACRERRQTAIRRNAIGERIESRKPPADHIIHTEAADLDRALIALGAAERETLVTRNRLRTAYESEARASLSPVAIQLGDVLQKRLDEIANLLAAAAKLDHAATHAGITLALPIIGGAAQLNAIMNDYVAATVARLRGAS